MFDPNAQIEISAAIHDFCIQLHQCDAGDARAAEV
jgi:hypothetical protein